MPALKVIPIRSTKQKGSAPIRRKLVVMVIYKCKQLHRGDESVGLRGLMSFPVPEIAIDSVQGQACEYLIFEAERKRVRLVTGPVLAMASRLCLLTACFQLFDARLQPFDFRCIG